MQVKVFEAKDMATALKLVKESLGADALILSTRTIRKGIGRLGKATVEVTAAIDTPELASEPSLFDNPYFAAGEPSPPKVSFDEVWRRRKVIDPLEEEVQELKGQLANLDVAALRQEISGLKEMMRNYAVTGFSGAKEAAVPGEEGAPLSRLIGDLVALGVEAATAEVVVRREFARRAPQERVSVRGFLAQAIANAVQCTGPFFGAAPQPRRIALLGPTGVGKTTTVAKLAAEYLLNRGRSLALVTIDIYRIAAAEQLKVYGEIMNVPVNVARSPQEFQEVLQLHRDKELVLIDTAGRSPRDRAGIDALYEFIGPGSGIESHLVLSAATRERENHAAVTRFSGTPLQSLILTKLDECETLGPLLNVHLRHGTPISYLTDGQRVPEDLRLAEPGEVGKLILATKKG
ncbi:MAG: flagellar biosynthesis protein FlhF [Desulfobulbaceae bacterium]|nr:flagellar biosynthesis protein FlhF [Desulfobulbaceae bacterium]